MFISGIIFSSFELPLMRFPVSTFILALFVLHTVMIPRSLNIFVTTPLRFLSAFLQNICYLKSLFNWFIFPLSCGSHIHLFPCLVIFIAYFLHWFTKTSIKKYHKIGDILKQQKLIFLQFCSLKLEDRDFSKFSFFWGFFSFFACRWSLSNCVLT